MIERPNVLEKTRRVFLRQRERQHVRTSGAHLGGLRLVVVQKHERIEAQGKFFRKGDKVGRFRIPIHAMRDKIFKPQRHVRVRFERRRQGGFFVLAR